MSPLRIHIHYQVVPADPLNKTCQRVCLSQHTVRQQKIKHENTTHDIKIEQKVVNMNRLTLNKRYEIEKRKF